MDVETAAPSRDFYMQTRLLVFRQFVSSPHEQSALRCVLQLSIRSRRSGLVRNGSPTAAHTLGFSQFCFTTDRSDDTKLLLISLKTRNELRLFEVAESLSLRILQVITADGSRLLWRSGLIFTAAWDEKSETHEVNVFHVSEGGRRVQRCGTPIAHADNLRIECWSAVGLCHRIALYDAKAQKIVVYEVKR